MKLASTCRFVKRFIHHGRYQTETDELGKLVVEAASKTNYRRAVQELARDGFGNIRRRLKRELISPWASSMVEGVTRA